MPPTPIPIYSSIVSKPSKVESAVVLIVQQWVMRETLVVSHVTLVMSYLVVTLGSVRVMEAGVVVTMCVEVSSLFT